MDHTTYFSVEESTLYSSQLNKGKLVRVGIEGPDKFCVKQQIYIESFFSTEKCFHLSWTLLNCLKVDDCYKMIVPKDFNHLIDITFP